MRTFLVLIFIGFVASAAIAQSKPRAEQPANLTPTTQPQNTSSKSRGDQTSSSRTKKASDRSSKSAQTGQGSSRSANVYPAPATTTQNTQTAAKTTATPTTTTSTGGKNAKSAPQGQSQTAKPLAVPTATPAVAEAAKPVKVQWLTIEEALEKSKTEKRKIFVDVYTDWCGWCKRMDETTFSDPRVAAYLNENYYPVKFNAEQQNEIVFKGKTYTFKKVGNRGYHELASEWLNNRLSFPTTVFLNEDLDVIQPLGGYLEPAKCETIITYFGTDSYKRTPWETYEKNFVNNRQR